MRLLAHPRGAVGVDEVGRGALAGPVVAAAVVLPRRFNLEGIDDSKRLSRAQRERQASRIRSEAIWAIAEVAAEEVDRMNVLQAAMSAMMSAVWELGARSGQILIDGDRVPKDMPANTRSVIGGDSLYACIAAASILAKTYRDALMRAYGSQFPAYGFERNVGYGTPEHLVALERCGPCAQHRHTFEPVAKASRQPCRLEA